MRKTVTAMMVAAVAVTGAAASADAANKKQKVDPEEAIKYRQHVMTAVGGHTKAVAQIVKGKVPVPHHLGGHAKALVDMSRTTLELFPKGTGPDAGDTKAKAEIWEDWKDFRKKAEAFNKAAVNLVKAARSNNPKTVKKATKKLGDSCENCHDDYKKEDD